jgi:hypothetical protein
MVALSFATHLDKGTGQGNIFGITENKDGSTVVLNEEVEKGMGVIV